jgi:hypothetical protein
LFESLTQSYIFFYSIQVHALLGEVAAARDAWERASNLSLAIVFAGDLNSEPDTGAIQLVATGQVPPRIIFLFCVFLKDAGLKGSRPRIQAAAQEFRAPASRTRIRQHT